MTAEELSRVVDQSLNSVDLKKLKEVKGAPVKDVIFAILKLVSNDYIGAAESAIQTINDYREGEFFRKYCQYVLGLVETTPEQRHKFLQEVEEKAKDFAGNVIFGIVDRMDNIHKEPVLARLTIARINEDISVEDFFRLSSMLERIPYVDLNKLPYYKEPYYDETGDTELLFATGALEIDTIDTKGGSNKYKLSRLGEALLRWGFGIHLELEHGKGTNVELDIATNTDINAIFDEKIEDAKLKWE